MLNEDTVESLQPISAVYDSEHAAQKSAALSTHTCKRNCFLPILIFHFPTLDSDGVVHGFALCTAVVVNDIYASVKTGRTLGGPGTCES